MEKVHFGICGLGCMGRSHFARLRGHPRAEIVAVCDRDERRCQGHWDDTLGNLDVVTTAGGRVAMDGINTYTGYEELIADPRVDAVLITLPTRLHADVAVAALNAGKHVLVEKPMAYRVGECDRMIRAAATSGRKLMVAQCIRFWPQYEMIQRSISADRIGKILFVTLRRLASPPTYSEGGWLLDADQSGGALLDLHVHDVDFAHYLLGVPDTLRAHGVACMSGGVDHLVALFGYRDGSYAMLEGGWAFTAPRPFEMSITVHGEQGTLEWNSTAGRDVLLYAGGQQPERIACDGDALRNEDDYFIDCVLAGRPVERCTPTSSRISIALAWLERRSIELQQQIDISDRLRRAWGA